MKLSMSAVIRRAVAMSALMMLAVACASSGGSRATDEEVAAAVAEHNEVVADEDKLICKNIRTTGSHIPRRVCQTRAEMDRARESAQGGMKNRWGDAGPAPGQ